MNNYLDHMFDRGFCVRCGAAEADVHEHGEPCANALRGTPPSDDQDSPAVEEGGARRDTAVPAPAETPGTSPSKETRACPFCAEEVLAAARLCKHCSSKLDPLVARDLPTTATQRDGAPVRQPAHSGPIGGGVTDASRPNENAKRSDGPAARKGGSNQLLVTLGIAAVLVGGGAAVVWVGSNQPSSPQATTCARAEVIMMSPGFAFRASDCSDGRNRNVLCDPTGGTTYTCSCAIDDRVLGPDVPFDRASASEPDHGEATWFMRMRVAMSGGGGRSWLYSGGYICERYPEMQIAGD